MSEDPDADEVTARRAVAAKGGEHPVNPNKQFIGSRRLRARYNDVSHMWIVRTLANDPTFPRPYKFGRLNFWALDELEAYERSKATA